MASTQAQSAGPRRSRRARGPAGKASPAPPPAPTSLLGRERELAELAELLEGERLLTLTGAPGIGKTRLARELADRLREGFPGGARLVDLAPVTRNRDVPRAVAAALSVQEQPGQDLTDTVVARLRRRRTLLVLDNCEHLLGACRKLVETLLAACAKLSIVATSRELLGVPAERVWQVPPLIVPPPEEEAQREALTDYPAVALFVARAAAVQAGFALNAYVAPAVAEICRRLDGIPLAIELAAARVESLIPQEIAARLDDRLDLLTAGSPTKTAHHETLRTALDWSHELLSEAEQALLRRLSVFVGGWEVEAVEAICVGAEVRAGESEQLLARLLSKSLVVADAGGLTPGRYRLLETVRAYAGERLEQAGEQAALRAAHARFYLDLAERAEPELTGARQEHWFGRLEPERANLRSALEWSLSTGAAQQALRLAGALVLFWRVRCHFSEGRELLDAAVSAGEGAPSRLRGKVLWGAGFMALMVGDTDAAISQLAESLSGFRKLGDLRGCARALLLLGNCTQYRDEARALSLLEESAALAREAGDSWCLAHALGVAGFDHGSRTELPAARPLFEECVTVARQAEDRQGLRMGLIGLGSVALRQGDFGSAELLLAEAVDVTGELGEDYSKATALQYLGELAIGRGDYGLARQLLEGALVLFREVGEPLSLPEPLVLLGEVAHAEGDRRGARVLFEEAQTRARVHGTSHVFALCGLAQLAAEEGKLDAGRRLLEEALELARARADRGGMAQALHGLGQITMDHGEAKRAAVLHNEALEIWSEIGSAPNMAAALESVAGLSVQAGRYEHAARLLGAAKAQRDANGYARAPWASSRYEADLTSVQRALGSKALHLALAKGAALSLGEAVAQASKERGPRGRPASGWSSLTQAERQVAALVAEGLTNPQIAERLYISLATVKAHLSHTFSKLGVEGRRDLAREVRRSREGPLEIEP